MGGDPLTLTMIDSSAAKAHRSASGTREGGRKGRSRGERQQKSTRPSTKNKFFSFEYTVVNSITYDYNSVPLAPRKSTVTFGRSCWIISGAQWPLLLFCARLTSTGKINRPCALTCDNVAIKYGEKKLTHTRMKRIIHVLPPLLTRASWQQKALSFDNPSVPLQGRSDDSTGPM
jgi:hypothetical protein